MTRLNRWLSSLLTPVNKEPTWVWIVLGMVFAVGFGFFVYASADFWSGL